MVCPLPGIILMSINSSCDSQVKKLEVRKIW